MLLLILAIAHKHFSPFGLVDGIDTGLVDEPLIKNCGLCPSQRNTVVDTLYSTARHLLHMHSAGETPSAPRKRPTNSLAMRIAHTLPVLSVQQQETGQQRETQQVSSSHRLVCWGRTD